MAKNRYVLEPLLAVIGNLRLRDLDVADVDRALAAVAVARSGSTVAMAHLELTRAITRAQAWNLVLRNVSALTGTPPGREGRPSRSMTLGQAKALTAAAEAAGPRTHAYVILSLCTDVQTEEARALQWEHVDFGDPNLEPPRPASIAVWRSVRARADTKTKTSRRTLALPQLATTALRALHQETQPEPGTWCSAPRPGRLWTRRTCGGRSGRSAGQRGSGRTGYPGNSGTPSSASCPTAKSPLKRSPASSATPAAKSPKRSTGTS